MALGVVFLVARSAVGQDAAPRLLPGELPIEYGRGMIEPKRFPTLSELMVRVERKEQAPALTFRFYGDQHNHYAPQWSRDGDALAVLRSDIDAHTSKIVLLPSLDADKPFALYTGVDSYDHMFAWSAGGGRAFAFSSTNEPAEHENIHLAVLRGEPRPVRITSGADGKTHAAIWTDGPAARVFFSAAGKLQAASLDFTRLGDAARVEPIGDGSDASWSPDGRRVAWIARSPDAESGFSLRLHDVPRGGDTRIYSAPGMVLRNPTWSPDARQIAFYGRSQSDPAWTLYVMAAPAPADLARAGDGTEPGQTEPGTAGRPIAAARDARAEEHFLNFGPAWDPRSDRLWLFTQPTDQEYYPLRWVASDGSRAGEVPYVRRLTTACDVAVNPDPSLRAIAFCAIEDLRQDVVLLILNHL